MGIRFTPSVKGGNDRSGTAQHNRLLSSVFKNSYHSATSWTLQEPKSNFRVPLRYFMGLHMHCTSPRRRWALLQVAPALFNANPTGPHVASTRNTRHKIDSNISSFVSCAGSSYRYNTKWLYHHVPSLCRYSPDNKLDLNTLRAYKSGSR